MANEILKRDENHVTVLAGVTDNEAQEIVMLRVDPTSKRLLLSATGMGEGTVTSVSVVTANGVSGSVATATTTPAITLTLGNITPSTVNALTLASQAIGFTIAGGTTSKTLTVPLDASVSGTNTGDNATNSQYSGLAASKADVGQTFYIGTTQVAINRASAALTLAGITLTTPDIGTPSAGVLTNTTGLPAASIVAGIIGVTGTRMTKVWTTDIESTNMPTVGGTEILTSLTAPQFTTIELGAASDTTLARVSAGIISVERVTIPTISSTSTLTNKRINPRLVTAASYTTNTGTSLDVATCDQFEITAQAGALLFNNPSGTPLGGQKLIIRIKDNGTARALTWDTQFRAMGNALPSTTVLSKTLYMGFIYNATDTKWDLVAVAQEA